MNEIGLRWRARIGSLKLLAGGVLLGVAIMLIVEVGQLSTALKNPGKPQTIAVEQLVDGSVGVGRYVTVSGYALYDAGYEQTKDGTKIATYYLLLDDDTGHLIAVEAPAVLPAARQPGSVTLTGMTRSTPTELNKLIQSDMPTFEQAGFATTPRLYLAENEAPPNKTSVLAMVLVLGALAIVCIVPFFFPGAVFVPRPVDPTVAPSSAKDMMAGVRITGRLHQLKQVEPTIEFSKRAQKFKNAVANIIPLPQSNLLIHIRYVVKTRLYGVVTVSKRESDWGVFITSDKVIDIEPGKLYGWRDRWAVRFRYKGRGDKQETLFASLDHAAAQAGLVELLQKTGFTVTTTLS
jgi:hypothetical protein